ncbi:MAG: hypothetical protein AAF830_02315 [Pseudomonadota bacterium]
MAELGRLGSGASCGIFVGMWLSLVSLPLWFFQGAILFPVSPELLLAPSGVGTAGLLAGAYFTFRRPDRRLALFLIPCALTHLFVAIAGHFSNALDWNSEHQDLANSVVNVFLLAQLVITLGLVYKTRAVLKPALGFALFNICYAFFGGFLSVMALTGNWI